MEKSKSYQEFFRGALKKFDVEEPDQLTGDKKKQFFDYMDKNWKGDKELDELNKATLFSVARKAAHRSKKAYWNEYEKASDEDKPKIARKANQDSKSSKLANKMLHIGKYNEDLEEGTFTQGRKDFADRIDKVIALKKRKEEKERETKKAKMQDQIGQANKKYYTARKSMKNESDEIEELDELKGSTLRSYIDKGRRDADLGATQAASGRRPVTDFERKIHNRYKGSIKASAKLSKGDYQKEDVELAETSHEKDMNPNKPVIVKGVKGMQSTPFTKKFKNQAVYEKWAESDAAGDCTIHQVMQEDIDILSAKEQKIVEIFNPANPSAYGISAYNNSSTVPSAKKMKGKVDPKVQQLAKLGLAGDDDISQVLRVLKDPSSAVKNPKLRDTILNIMQKLMDIVTADPTILMKTKASLRNEELAVEHVCSAASLYCELYDALEIDADVHLNLNDIILSEALTLSGRRKRSITMRRLEPKLQRKKELMKRRIAPSDVVMNRAEKAAHKLIMQKRLLKTRNYTDLSPTEKTNIEKKMQQFEPSVKKLAKKLFPRLKRAETQRYQATKAKPSPSEK